MPLKEFIEKSKKAHGDKYDYSKSNYVNKNTKIEIICKIHGSFFQIPRQHYRGNNCPKCSHKSLDKNSFILKSQKIHENKFDYSDVVYNKITEKIKIQCNNCNSFFYQTPDNHLRGHGCPYCNKYGILTKEIFIKKAIKKYKDRFNYSSVEFVNGKTKVKIKCNVCNSILNHTPINHLMRGGCKTCAYNQKRDSKENFIIKANKIHNNHYIYNKIIYKSNCQKIEIICPKHGEFWQTPNSHLQQKAGCPKCGKRISKQEENFLNFLKIPKRQLYINGFYFDGYDPETNTIYEYLGDYWHGNPKCYKKEDLNEITHKTFGELYNETGKRLKKLKENGYNIKYVWEEDWQKFIKNNQCIENPIKEFNIGDLI